jgi:hypothetical protein
LQSAGKDNTASVLLKSSDIDFLALGGSAVFAACFEGFREELAHNFGAGDFLFGG